MEQILARILFPSITLSWMTVMTSCSLPLLPQHCKNLTEAFDPITLITGSHVVPTNPLTSQGQEAF